MKKFILVATLLCLSTSTYADVFYTPFEKGIEKGPPFTVGSELIFITDNVSLSVEIRQTSDTEIRRNSNTIIPMIIVPMIIGRFVFKF